MCFIFYSNETDLEIRHEITETLFQNIGLNMFKDYSIVGRYAV